MMIIMKAHMIRSSKGELSSVEMCIFSILPNHVWEYSHGRTAKNQFCCGLDNTEILGS